MLVSMAWVLAACGDGGNADGGPSKCNYGWSAPCQSDADCWGPGYVCAHLTINQKVPKHCTTVCTTDSECTGYDSCPLYVTSHHTCVSVTNVCLYY
jgi:hypothetical protein